jgi:tRNA nucleotidyltransferase/poly(A) polymerase
MPSAVEQIGQEIGRRMVDAGYTAFLVGPGLRDLLSGISPSHFELSTDAPLSQILECFPNGVLIGDDTVMVPSQAGPLDVNPFRASARIESDLAHRDFTINAIAYDIADRKWVDPHGGRADLERGLIRAVRCARDRIAEDPIRALRAIRLAATRGWELDPELESALGDARSALSEIPREPVRRELVAILLSTGAARALEQLDQSQISSKLAPGARPGAGAVLDRLPCDLELRLAGWLRGTQVRRVLQGLRFPHPTIDRVERLLRYHHADAQLQTLGAAAAARFARRVGAQQLIALIALREAEIETTGAESEETRNALQVLREALALVRDAERIAIERNRLMVSGADVMDCLGCGPGPRVGRAIAYLATRIRLNPALNSPDALRELLRDWTDDASESKGFAD